MYKFKELKVERRLYIVGIKNIEFSILGITSTEIVNGYLKIECENRRGNIIVLFIPINHINANKVRIGNNMIAPTIFFGTLSWMGMITILLLSLKLDGDTIIFKKKG